MTRNDKPTYREKGRAVFLTVMMVLSVVAMSAAFAGGAAAAATAVNSDDTASGESDITVTHDASDSNVAYVVSADATYDAGTDLYASASADSSGETTFENVDITSLAADDYNVYAVSGSSSATAEPGDGDSLDTDWSDVENVDELTVEAANYEVSNIDAPPYAPYGADITVNATIENTGDLEGDQTVSYHVTGEGNGAGALTFNQDDEKDSQSNVVISPGEEANVEFVPNTGDDAVFSGAETDANNDYGHGVATDDDNAGTDLTIATDNSGTVSTDVVNADTREPVADTTVNIYDADDYNADPSTAVPLDTLTTNDDGFVRFEGLAVGPDQGSSYDYVVEAEGSDLLVSNTRTASLYTPGQTGDSVEVELESDEAPQEIGIGVFDEEEQEIVSNETTLLADGELDNTQTYVVYSQTQNDDDRAVNRDVTVDLSTAELEPAGFDIASFLDAQGDSTKDLTVTISPDSPEGNIDDNAATGNWSYETFDVSADYANESNMTDGDIQPIVKNLIDGEAVSGLDDDATADDSSAAANVTYVLEGDEVVTGEIRDGETQEPIEDANVWVAYDGQVDQSYDYINETFVNDEGDSFLTAETNEDGAYVVSGLAGEQTDFNLYVSYNDQYDQINLSSEAAGQFVAGTDQNLNTGDPNDQVTQDVAIFQEDVVFDYRTNVYVEEDGEWVNATSLPLDDTTNVQIVTERNPQTGDDEWSPAPGQDVELTTDDGTVGALDATNLTTDDNGTAMTTFVGGPNTGVTDINATTENSEDTEFTTDENQNAEVEVFGVGQITGDVVDADDNNIPGANVELYVWNATSQEYDLVGERETGATGSYAFTDLRTGMDYRTEATFNGQTGYTIDENLPLGTTNADIVIEGVEAPEGFAVSDLAAPADAAQGDTITVTANVTNTGAESSTNTVDYTFDGAVVDSTDVTLDAGESTTVEFEYTVDAEAGDYEHGVSTSLNDQTATLTVTENDGNNDFDVSQYDTNDNGQIDINEVLTAIQDNNNGDIGTTDVLTVLQAYNTDQEV
ncbi:surface glycoprotein [Natrinema longum]|uniref:Surface glycoprotein n=1 Tax=Natrinema longum TaxID=370324 RepID=A0A8A2U7H7_9EURY|nr:surface glycoprotein [Natrinema longum]MBZ6494062.1 surface glycoprotein [Natrinema longum]QSW84604.1 surface glycoprotein [Natrinema longum]